MQENRLSPEDIDKRLDELSIKYQTLCDWITDNERLYLSLRHDVREAVNSRRVSDLASSSNQEILQNVIDKELKSPTLDDIENMIRNESPKVYDNFVLAENLKKRLESQMENLNKRLIKYMSDRKVELFLSENRT